MKFKKSLIISIFWLAIAGICGTFTVFAGLYLYLSPKLPAVETLRDVRLQTPLRVYSSDKKLIGEFGEKRRTPISYNDIPEYYIKAILAAEDDQFYYHHGVSIKGLLRAASQLLLTGHIQSGGSTITMQVARNFFLTRQQTFARKFNEILLALQIERELPKEEILELYVNVIFLGNRAYGIQAASKVYYGKDIAQLNLAQLAMIAGLPKAPSTFNPIVNPSRALIRRNWILGRMKELGYINDEQFQTAVNEPVSAKYHGLNLELNSPYVAEMARKKAVSLFGESAYTDGYQVFTTVDSQLQATAQHAVINGLLTYDQRHGYRGPEQQLDPVYLPDNGESNPVLITTDSKPVNSTDDTRSIEELNAEKTEIPIPPNLELAPWLNALKEIPEYGGLQPAVVAATQEKSITAVLTDGSLVKVDWENGLAGARPYITENRRGTKPKAPEDVVSIGDVIRLRQIDNQWHMFQLPVAQAALVALNPDDGAIRSLVGGFDFNQSHFNRATQASRQPGSNFKPFIYTAALENGFTAASIINDAPIVFDDAHLEGTWRPENDGGKFYGPTRLRKALYKSRNLVSIRILNSMGIAQAISSMDRFGFDKSQLPRDLSLALGSSALTPLQVAAGYAVFANGGYQIEPYLIDFITDVENEKVYSAEPATVCRNCDNRESDHDTVEQNEIFPEEARSTQVSATDILPGMSDTEETGEIPLENDIFESMSEELSDSEALPNTDIQTRPRAIRVMDEQVAYLINSMLRDVIDKGTGRKAKVLGRHDLAGKTGTTNGPNDAWFSGYNHHIVATTWLGFDQNLPLGTREYGGSAALPIWIDFMRQALEGVEEAVRKQPDGMATVSINPETGKRAQPGDAKAIFEIFRTDNLPAITDLDNNINPSNNSGDNAIAEELF